MFNMSESFVKRVEEVIVKRWDSGVLSNYRGVTYAYRDVARKIAKLHILFEESGIQKGDKIALCGRNSADWGVLFMGTLTYGAVAVPILNDFTPEIVHNIVNHSEAKLLCAGDGTWDHLDFTAMPNIMGALRIEDFSIRESRSEALRATRAKLNELFGKRYPERFSAKDVCYEAEPSIDTLAMINYTSGSTGLSKGVMLSYASMLGNLDFAIQALGKHPGKTVVSMLPMAHMYGMAFEFIYEFMTGMHIYFLTKVPSPQIIADALANVKPAIVIAVPLIIEKIVRKKVFPMLEKPHMKVLMSIPLVNDKIRETIREKLLAAFGGNVIEVVIGGAALNKDVENFLRSINFPYTVGYGMTECGPILSYDWWETFKPGSCGKAALGMTLKIDSADPENIVGEICAKGQNVMQGYFKNEEATAEAIDSDGWLHTGDLGVIDKDGYLFIRGRIKNMLLGPSGQNIYPEEIEDKLNNLLYVGESVVVDRGGRLVALVYPDMEQVEANPVEDLHAAITADVKVLNKELPNYSQISSVEVRDTEFEKTPKKSIKRYLYK